MYNEASTTSTTENVNQSGIITWAFRDPNEPAVVSFVSDDVNALFTPNVSVGSNLTFYSSNNNESLYQPKVNNESSANDNKAIFFLVTLEDG